MPKHIKNYKFLKKIIHNFKEKNLNNKDKSIKLFKMREIFTVIIVVTKAAVILMRVI